MECKSCSYFTGFFFFALFGFLAVHYAQMKTPETGRSMASQYQTIKPWYDASWKY